MKQAASAVRRQRRRSGSACLEFAVTAPILLILFVIAVDYSRLFHCQITIAQCARNGALYGSSLHSYQETTWVSPYNTGSPTDDDIKTVAIADGATMNPPLTTGNVTVTHNNGSDGNAAVQVTVSYTFSSMSNLPGLPSTLTLRATCSMRTAS